MTFLPIRTRQVQIAMTSLALAPYHLRALAFLLDTMLVLLFGLFFLNSYFLPENFPGVQEALGQKFQDYAVIIHEKSITESARIDFQLNPKEQECVQFIATFIFFIFWFYGALSKICLKGSSLGKLIFCLQVVSLKNFEPLSPWDAIFRSGIKSMTLWMYFPFLIIDYLFPLFNQKKQSIHDMICQTLVIVSDKAFTLRDEGEDAESL
jgi:uncharacterized RDD family membrane protein YckC